MPVIEVTMGRGQADKKQKQELISEFTQSAMKITKLPKQAFTILIYELEADSIGIAGKTLEELHKDIS